MRKVTDPMMSPGPTAPEAVLLGGDLRVEVNAGSGAGGWTAGLISEYDSASMPFVNGSYVEGRGWTLFFGVPLALRSGLYSLNIAYQDGSEHVDHTQPRSVWVLEEWPESITFGHIGDTHQPDNPDPLASFVHEANLIRPDIVLYGGDVVELESAASGWIYLQSILDRLEVPLFLVPGNHDFISGGIYYEQYGGPTNYSRVIGDFLFLALTGRGGGYLPPDQLQWAESVLQRYPDKIKIVAHHKPLFSYPGGAEITGSWEETEALVDYMYRDWAQNLGAAKELLRLIEEYDVRLLLNAHIHFDNIYIYNDRHYILTVSPCGGSLPEGLYNGQRLIEVDTDGNVYLDDYAIRDMFDPPNAIPVGNVTYYYKAANDGTETAVSATVMNDLEMELTDARLEFVVSGSQPAENYVFRTTQPESYEVITMDEGHYFIAYFDIPAQSTVDVTLAAEADGAKPSIEVTFPEDHEPGSEIPVTLTATDEGWGVQSLASSYSTDGGETWTPVQLFFEPLVDRDNYVIDYPETSHTFTVADVPVGSVLEVRVEVLDYAGNTETALESFSVGALEPTEHTLSVSTSPITGVSFRVGDGSYTSPYEEALEVGVYMITMPGEATVGGVNYTFSGWDDGETDPERIVSLDEDTALTANYDEVEVEEPEPEPELEPDPELEEEPPRGIPIPTASVAMGVILGVLVVFYLNRRS